MASPPSLLSLFIGFSLLLSCSDAAQPSPTGSAPANNDATPGSYAEVTKDWKTWYAYTYRHIHLSQDFTPLNYRSREISKAAFLDSLAGGGYIAMTTGAEGEVYQLFPLKKEQSDIRSGIIQMATDARQLMALEGKPLPPLSFTDLNGKTWDNKSTGGKLLLIKCWFINCVACVKEFPDLNKLVDQYAGREDVLFLSLATDERKDLEAFLSERDFKYAVAPEAEPYMTGSLSVMSYPTHLLVGRDGTILKVTNKIEDLLPSLERAIQ